jgi:hypothetical protein
LFICFVFDFAQPASKIWAIGRKSINEASQNVGTNHDEVRLIDEHREEAVLTWCQSHQVLQK